MLDGVFAGRDGTVAAIDRSGGVGAAIARKPGALGGDEPILAGGLVLRVHAGCHTNLRVEAVPHLPARGHVSSPACRVAEDRFAGGSHQAGRVAVHDGIGHEHRGLTLYGRSFTLHAREHDGPFIRAEPDAFRLIPNELVPLPLQQLQPD